jgi:mRNA interferase MazF
MNGERSHGSSSWFYYIYVLVRFQDGFNHSSFGSSSLLAIPYFPYYPTIDVPFPFIDSKTRKKRPALVISNPAFQEANGALILAMITSAERGSWHGDVALKDWREAGLRKPSIIRWKLFTLDSSLILSQRSSLSAYDDAAARKGLALVLARAVA